MREIKFRGKLLKEQQSVNDPLNNWFYGDLVHELDTGKTFILDVSHTNKGKATFRELGLEVIPNTIGQYTGLKDKNGKEIYEGDMLSLKDEVGNRGQVTVCFDDGGFIVFKGLAWRHIGHYNADRNEIEIIGNIHEVAK